MILVHITNNPVDADHFASKLDDKEIDFQTIDKSDSSFSGIDTQQTEFYIDETQFQKFIDEFPEHLNKSQIENIKDTIRSNSTKSKGKGETWKIYIGIIVFIIIASIYILIQQNRRPSSKTEIIDNKFYQENITDDNYPFYVDYSKNGKRIKTYFKKTETIYAIEIDKDFNDMAEKTIYFDVYGNKNYLAFDKDQNGIYEKTIEYDDKGKIMFIQFDPNQNLRIDSIQAFSEKDSINPISTDIFDKNSGRFKLRKSFLNTKSSDE